MDQLMILKRLIPEADEIDLQIELDMACMTIYNRRCGVYDGQSDVEPQYRGLQLEMAVASYNKRGAEGQTSHSENGVSRVYSGAGQYPATLLNQIIPKLRGVK